MEHANKSKAKVTGSKCRYLLVLALILKHFSPRHACVVRRPYLIQTKTKSHYESKVTKSKRTTKKAYGMLHVYRYKYYHCSHRLVIIKRTKNVINSKSSLRAPQNESAKDCNRAIAQGREDIYHVFRSIFAFIKQNRYRHCDNVVSNKLDLRRLCYCLEYIHLFIPTVVWKSLLINVNRSQWFLLT